MTAVLGYIAAALVLAPVVGMIFRKPEPLSTVLEVRDDILDTF